MAISFPSSPSTDDVYLYNGVKYIYDGTKWISGGQSFNDANYVQTSGDTITGNLVLDADLTVDTDTLHVDSANDRVGIGTDSPASKLTVAGNVDISGAANKFVGPTAAQGSTAANPTYSFSGQSTGMFLAGSNVLGFSTDATERLRIDSSGDVGIGTTGPDVALDVNGEVRASTGILFGTDTAAANSLDDYEEGTFTPTVFGLSTAGTYTPTTAAGTYTKVGNQVTVIGTITAITEVSAGSGAVQIGNLPFTSKAAANTYATGAIELHEFNVDASTVGLSVLLLNNDNNLYIRESRDASTVGNVTCPNITSGSSNIRFTITYLVD